VLGSLANDSLPTATQVTAWLTQGAAIIDRHLAGAGYTVPVLNTATVYPELTALNDLYAAAIAAQARSLDTIQGSEENRSETWLTRFYAQLQALAASTLADVPMTSGALPTARRVRFTQLKRVDGYSAVYDDDMDMDA